MLKPGATLIDIGINRLQMIMERTELSETVILNRVKNCRLDNSSPGESALLQFPVDEQYCFRRKKVEKTL
ncbi:MAG: hypothetical protein CM1200mP30_15490 [Pseudomonadota bacterium]|nr:MAG: hypothetical protein CM1200mP30_15490 [Pseudomonadota bacterium]